MIQKLKSLLEKLRNYLINKLSTKPLTIEEQKVKELEHLQLLQKRKQFLEEQRRIPRSQLKVYVLNGQSFILPPIEPDEEWTSKFLAEQAAVQLAKIGYLHKVNDGDEFYPPTRIDKIKIIQEKL